MTIPNNNEKNDNVGCIRTIDIKDDNNNTSEPKNNVEEKKSSFLEQAFSSTCPPGNNSNEDGNSVGASVSNATNNNDNSDNINRFVFNDEEEEEERDNLNGSERKRKSRPGRASRRRKAKLRAIEEAEKRLWEEYGRNKGNYNYLSRGEKRNTSATTSLLSTNNNENNTILPIDRSLDLWNGVVKRRQEKNYNDFLKEDEMMLMGQLGYIPGNAVAIVVRAHQYPQLFLPKDNIPLVLQLYPIALRHSYKGGKSDGRKFKSRKRGNPKMDENNSKTIIEPFPTMYWLTHPLLRILTSKLEMGDTHNVKSMEKKILLSLNQQHEQQAVTSHNNLMTMMKDAHEAYSQERWDLLTEEDQLLLKKEYASCYHVLQPQTTGVAGIRLTDKNYAKIKCLHTHLAHYLSNGPGSSSNIIGKWVMEEICKLIQKQNICTTTI